MTRGIGKIHTKSSEHLKQRKMLRKKMISKEQRGTVTGAKRSYLKQGRIKFNKENGRSSRARVPGKKLYKAIIEKSKQFLRGRMMKTKLAILKEEKRVMVESLAALRNKAEKELAEYMQVRMTRDELRQELLHGIDEFVTLKTLETQLMKELD